MSRYDNFMEAKEESVAKLEAIDSALAELYDEFTADAAALITSDNTPATDEAGEARRRGRELFEIDHSRKWFGEMRLRILEQRRIVAWDIGRHLVHFPACMCGGEGEGHAGTCTVPAPQTPEGPTPDQTGTEPLH